MSARAPTPAGNGKEGTVANKFLKKARREGEDESKRVFSWMRKSRGGMAVSKFDSAVMV
jgi:hypothetical protein